MELYWRDCDGCWKEVEVWRDEGDVVGAWDEDWVWIAFEAGEYVGAEIVDGADEVFGTHEEVGEGEAEEDGEDPGAHEACIHTISDSYMFGLSLSENVPSTVFFGLSLISCVLPNVIPTM